MTLRSARFRLVALAAIAGVVALVVVGRAAHDGGAATKPIKRAMHAAVALDVRDRELPADRDPDPRGALRLEGQVIDEAGLPVGGATVTLDSRPARRATSEADGSFVIDGLLAARYSVVARAGEACGGPVQVKLSATTEPVILTLHTGSLVSVRVVKAADHAPIAGAAVELRSFDARSEQTGSDGVARFAGVMPWRYSVVASAPGYGTAYESIAVANAGQSLTLELALSPGVRVAGRVVDTDGRPIAGAHVGYERTTDPLWERPARVRDPVTTDAAGAFSFAALAAGSYRFIAGDDAHAPGAVAPVVIDGVHAVDNLTIELSAGAAIAGRVIQADGSPAAGAIVRIAPRENAFRPVPRQTAAATDGGFRMAGLPRQSVYLVAFGGDASSETIEVDLTATSERRDLVVKLGVEGVIAGFVVDAKGQPVDGAQVAAYPPLGDDVIETARLRTAAVALTDGGGAFRLVGLPDGAYTLRAYRDAVPAGTDWMPTGTAARVGDMQVRVVLPGDGSVIGHVALPDGTPPPVAFVRLGTRPPIPVGDGGAFRVTRVAAGRTSLTVNGPSFETIVVPNVNVDADRETDVGTITVRKGRSIVGHVLASDGTPVPGASVFCGKRVVGSGSNLTSQTWGPAGSSGATRTTETDASGYYAIRGMGPMEAVVIADHPTLGRSATVRVPASTESSTIDLVLASPGAIEGTIARGGQPLPRFQVTASPHPVTNSANFVVTTDDKGHYRFDRLVPGDYLVTATGGMHPIAGVTQTGSLVTVAENQTARFDVDLPATTVDIVVTLRDQAGAPVRMAEVHLLPGAFAADVAHAIHTAEAHLTGGFSAFNIVAEGRPARIRRVPPSDYTLCAVPYPAELKDLDPAEIAQFVDTQARNLPAYCRPLPVAAQPPEQPVAFDVRLPPLPRH